MRNANDIWQRPDWPNWRYDLSTLAPTLADVGRAQGFLFGRLADIGFLRDQAALSALTGDVVNTSEIESEHLDAASVRSSVGRRLGVDVGAVAPVDRHIEGVVEMVLDATLNPNAPLTLARLLGWHAGLFPTGYSGISKIRVGAFRDDATRPMQVASGPIGRRRVHFEAPPSSRIETEITRFLDWVDIDEGHHQVIKAGLGHLWFVTLHPFDDGNGRIARAVGDLLLARADRCGKRFYSFSARIQQVRNEYYEILERTQKGSLDVTPWLDWFLRTLLAALTTAEKNLDSVLFKSRFWRRWAETPLNERQIKVLNRFLDGFEGKLTNAKWAALAKCSPDTALRDITQLLSYGILERSAGAGRSTSYLLGQID